MNNLIVDKQWNMEAEWSEVGTRKELEENLHLCEGEEIKEVNVGCPFNDSIGERSDRYIICGNSDEDIRDKALKLYCGIYINLLCSVEHGDITVALLKEKEETEDLDIDWLEDLCL